GEVGQDPVELHGDRLLGKGFRDGLGDRFAGCAWFDATLVAIGKSKEGHVKISWLTPAYDAGKRIQLVSVMGGRVEFDRLAGEIRAPAAVAPRSIPGRFQRQPLRAGVEARAAPGLAAADPGEADPASG